MTSWHEERTMTFPNPAATLSHPSTPPYPTLPYFTPPYAASLPHPTPRHPTPPQM